MWFLFDYNGIVFGRIMCTVCKALMWCFENRFKLFKQRIYFTFQKGDRE